MNDIKAIKAAFKKQYPRDAIIHACYQDLESPFGIIISLLRDYFYLPKPIGYNLASELTKEYKLEEPKHGNINHAKLYEMYAHYKRMYKHSAISQNRHHYAKKCREYKYAMNKAQREFSQTCKIYEMLNNRNLR